MAENKSLKMDQKHINLRNRATKIMLAYIRGKHTERIRELSEKDDVLSDLAWKLLNAGFIPDDIRDDLYDSDDNLDLYSVIQHAWYAAIKEAEAEIVSYRINDSDMVLRLGRLARWRDSSWYYDEDVTFPQALYAILSQREDHVDALMQGQVPNIQMNGRYVFAEAVVSAMEYDPVWQRLRGSEEALVAYARWRAGLDVSNANTFTCMRALGMSPEQMRDETILALAVLEPDWVWSREAGRRGIPIPHLYGSARREWERGHEDRRIETEASVVWVHRGNVPFPLYMAKILYKRYKDNPFVANWIEPRIKDEEIDDPDDPFGPSVSAWKYWKEHQEE